MKLIDYISYGVLFLMLCAFVTILILGVPFYIAFDCLGPPVIGISLGRWWRSYQRRKAARTMTNGLPAPDSSSSPYSDQSDSPVSFTGSPNHDRHYD
jgi:hypothetical protein